MTTTAYATKHLNEIAIRQIRAEQDFIGCLRSFGELSFAEAEKVLTYFIRKKLVKVTIDRITVKHGRYFDREFLQKLADTL
jgi:hypothetical protein